MLPASSGVVVAATDGSALNNPHGPAGWAWYISDQSWAAGAFRQASNQAAELFAVLALLRAVPKDLPVLVRSDSQFTINVCTKWMRGWKAKGWRKADGAEPANLPLLQDLDKALAGRSVQFEWVRGHSGDRMNEIADKICTAASRSIAAHQEVLTGPGWTNPPLTVVQPSQVLRPPGSIGRGAAASTPLAPVVASTKAPKAVLCPSCDRPINPLTFECGGCSE